ncbi:MAG TPA: hypothetical protein DCL01_13230 [Thauera sp.]|nr:hypothetical protein [Thauera sp.]HHW65385.1 virulence RhuM family protein [Rhodocyclaceae bacterium]
MLEAWLFVAEDSVEAAIRKFRIAVADGKTYATQHYNLDAIISVGYRVNSVRAGSRGAAGLEC